LRKETTVKKTLSVIVAAFVLLAVVLAPAPAAAQSLKNADNIDLNGPPPRLPNGKPDMSGLWARPGTQDITRSFQNPNGMMNKGEPNPLPFTEWGQAQWDNYNPPQYGDYAGSCMPFGWIRSFTPHPMQILQNNDYISFLFEQSTMFQVVNTEGLPHRPELPPTWFGDTRGRWEGDTLVLEAVNINGNVKLGTIGHPMSSEGKLTMYFTRPSMGKINFKWVWDDPKTYTRPISNERVFILTPKNELLEYGCMEGNLGALLEGAITPWLGNTDSDTNRVYTPDRQWPAYDLTRSQTVTGTITQVVQPDPFVLVKVNAGGRVLDVVLAPRVRMDFRGLTFEDIKVGAAVTLQAVPHKQRATEFRGQTLTIDNQTIDLR
jgi:hypothetical protein